MGGGVEGPLDGVEGVVEALLDSPVGLMVGLGGQGVD